MAVASKLRRRGLLLLLAFGLLALGGLDGCRSLRARRAAHRPSYRRVSSPVAFEMVRDTPEMLILDLRSPEEYLGETGHLRRAYNIPLDRLPFRLLEISAWREETILVYCRARGDCSEAGMAILMSSGFTDAVLMVGGIDSWIEEGFRTELPPALAGQRPETAAPPEGVLPPPPPPH